ncbi:hypothetical protein HSBAA_55720 [Vreelandella sulfidaeris]|uniref:Uncharacterized protein n=1 Tax=Vreelandella sulfidaeris TaxID=115553 RepID=A0A455UDE8_9GAMM|nr:hypothetical protein HSBAA_55720 [Halomonas sulfidaeris]
MGLVDMKLGRWGLKRLETQQEVVILVLHYQYWIKGLAQPVHRVKKAYWRLASADLLNENGLESLAQQHYHTLHQYVTDLALEQWEPALVARLKAAVKETYS